MKLRTTALAMAFALSSTFALAQQMKRPAPKVARPVFRE
jgi:hypothetical protein